MPKNVKIAINYIIIWSAATTTTTAKDIFRRFTEFIIYKCIKRKQFNESLINVSIQKSINAADFNENYDLTCIK